MVVLTRLWKWIQSQPIPTTLELVKDVVCWSAIIYLASCRIKDGSPLQAVETFWIWSMLFCGIGIIASCLMMLWPRACDLLNKLEP